MVKWAAWVVMMLCALPAGCGENPAPGGQGGPAGQAPQTAIEAEDVALMNRLIKAKNAEVGKWSVPGVATFTLGQEQALAEDGVIFGLLKTYHQTRFLASPELLDAVVQQGLLKRNPEFPRWKQRSLQQFWGDYVVMRMKEPLKAADAKELATEFSMYLDVKFTMRSAAINRRLQAFVAAEEHWRKVMNDWRKWEEKNFAREQAAREARDKQMLKNAIDWLSTKHFPGT